MSKKTYETPEPIKIKRTGEPPLRFKATAWWDGSTQTHNSTRWTEVTIYKTVGGKYVCEVGNYTQWEGETDFINAKAFNAPQELIDWLKKDSDGDYGTRMGKASQEALEEAAKEDPAFTEAWQEVVD